MHIHIIYSRLTRFDLANNNTPFSGSPGDLFKHRTLDLHPEVTYDVRLPDQIGRPFRPDSRILALGSAALFALTQDNNIHKHRGYCLTYKNLPLIATYEPIEAWEFREDEEDDDDSKGDEKDVARTKRSNYLFWLLADFNKLLRPRRTVFRIKARQIRPSARAFADWLRARPQEARLVIDIETRIQDHALDCIGVLDVDTAEAFVFPFYGPNGRTCYANNDVARVWRALFNTLRRCLIIGHNLAFDLAILAGKYNLPLPSRVYDTMLAMHRQFPLVEKSLSHAISFYTSATRNHKGDIRPNTSEANFNQLLLYNADDLALTADVYLSQLEYHAENAALKSSAELANRLLPVTLLMSLTGIAVDEQRREQVKAEQEQRLIQLNRVVRILSADPLFNPNSSKQIAAYFYGRLKYPVLELTESGAPSTSEKTLYKLQLKQPNPLIPIIIAYKQLQKSTSMLDARLR